MEVCSAYTSGDPIIAGSPSLRTPSHHGTNRSVPLESPSSTHELISPLTCAYVVRELKGLAAVERVFARPDAAPLHWVAFFRVPTVE